MLQLLIIRIEIPLACRLESENCPHTILNYKWVITSSWMTSSGSIHTRVWQLISWLVDWTEDVNYISACSTGVKRSRLTPCHVAMLVCFNKCLLLSVWSVWSVLSVKWFVLCTANVMTFIRIPNQHSLRSRHAIRSSTFSQLYSPHFVYYFEPNWEVGM